MIRRTIKYGLITGLILVVGSFLVFGQNAWSYARSTLHGWRTSMNDSVPVEYELERAREMLDEIIPEMHANIRMIAKEEVELAHLKQDIARSEEALAEQETRISRLTNLLEGEKVFFTFGDNRYSRTEVKRDLANKFERYKEAQVVLAGKRKLLEQRKRSLQSAIEMLDKARGKKAILEQKVAALASKHRLIQAASIGSEMEMSDSTLAQADKLIADIQKRLEVSERVLAHEGRFVEPIQMDVGTEEELISEVRGYFLDRDTDQLTARAEASESAGARQ
jgi:hypothetical protein